MAPAAVPWLHASSSDGRLGKPVLARTRVTLPERLAKGLQDSAEGRGRTVPQGGGGTITSPSSKPATTKAARSLAFSRTASLGMTQQRTIKFQQQMSFCLNRSRSGSVSAASSAAESSPSSPSRAKQGLAARGTHKADKQDLPAWFPALPKERFAREPLLQDWLSPSSPGGANGRSESSPQQGDATSGSSPPFATDGFMGDWIRRTRPRSATTPGLAATVKQEGQAGGEPRLALSGLMAQKTARLEGLLLPDESPQMADGATRDRQNLGDTSPTAGWSPDTTQLPVQQQDCATLNFEHWGVDDTYVTTLCQEASQASMPIERVRLGGNRITAQTLESLRSLSPSLKSLRYLSLSSAGLFQQSGEHMAIFLHAIQPSLVELDLSSTSMCDAALEVICKALRRHCPDLEVLRLASNRLGSRIQGAKGLAAFLLGGGERLRVLDLQWNSFQGEAAEILFDAIYQSGVHLHSPFATLDMAWNHLGKRCSNRSKGLHACPCHICTATAKALKMLGSVLQDHKSLFHLDLSWNGICSTGCQIIADGVRKNHTLFGLHLVGNEAVLDDLGFVKPRQPLHFQPQGESDVSRDGLYECLDDLRQGVKDVQPNMFGLRDEDFSEVRRDAKVCWICESWVELRVTYTPQIPPEKVKHVFAFFSIDGFKQATKLARVDERRNPKRNSLSRRESVASPKKRGSFKGATEARANRLGTTLRIDTTESTLNLTGVSDSPLSGTLSPFIRPRRMSLGPATPKVAGTIARWKGSRMFPPMRQPVEVIFQVNDRLAVSDDMPQTHLRRPVSIWLAEETVDSDTPRASRTAEPAEAKGMIAVAMSANVATVPLPVLQRFQEGEQVALCVLDDPARRDAVAVKPRMTVEKPEAAPPQWTYETSSFKGFARDTSDMMAHCFDEDWQHVNLPHSLRQSEVEDLRRYIRPLYRRVVCSFHLTAYCGWSFPWSAPGIPMLAFSTFLQRASHNPERFFTSDFQVRSADTIWIAANVVRMKPEERSKMISLSHKGLSRFQFLEAIIRVASTRTHHVGQRETIVTAMKRLFRDVNFEQFSEEREDFHNSLFNEECCEVLRESESILMPLYELYKTHMPFPGRIGPTCGLSYGAWLKLMSDARAGDLDVMHEHVGRAFALGKEVRVDELQSWQHMELTYYEFIIAVGALIYHQRSFEREFFADALADFIEDNLSEALANAEKDKGIISSSTQDGATSALLELVRHIFNSDVDGNGKMTKRSLKRVLYQRDMLKQLEDIGFHLPDPDDFDEFYMHTGIFDPAGVSLSELMEGFLRMRDEILWQRRAVAYFHKVFRQYDVDKSGAITSEEWRNLCSNPEVLKKLRALGVDMDDVKRIGEEMLWEGAEALSEDAMVKAFKAVHRPGLGGNRGVNFLRQAFVDAGLDEHGNMSKTVYIKTFCNNRVTHHLEKLRLPVPDWLHMFEALDTDGGGTLSWDELSQGVSALWKEEAKNRFHATSEFAATQ